MKFVIFLAALMAAQANADSTRTQIFTAKAGEHYLKVLSCHPSEQDKQDGVGNIVVVSDCEGAYPNGNCKPAHKLIRYDAYQVMNIASKIPIPHPKALARPMDLVLIEKIEDCPDGKTCLNYADGIELTVAPEEFIEERRSGFLWYYQVTEEALKRKLIDRNQSVAACGGNS